MTTLGICLRPRLAATSRRIPEVARWPHRRSLYALSLLALALLWTPAAAQQRAAAAVATGASVQRDPGTGAVGWPGFRGADRDGVSRETGLLDAWPAGGPRELWRVAAGAGYSGVSIDADRAFTLWQEAGKQVLVALATGSGEVLWKHALGPAFSSPYGDGPRSTPVIDDGRVFAVDANGRLSAVRTGDGREIWSHDLEREFGARIPSIGYASTPLVEGAHLLVEVGAEERAFIAFDKRTGAVVWSSQSDEPAYVSPVVLTWQDERQVVFFSASGLYALAPGDGRLLWHHPWSSPCPSTGIPLNAASPVFIPPDRLFVSSAWGDHKGGAVLRILEREGDLAVAEVWHAPLIDSEIATAVLVDGYLYGFKGSILVAVDSETGKLRWSARGFGRGSLIAADGKLIVLGERGDLALVEANPDEYRELASAQILTGRSWTSPALAYGRLFVRNHEEIASFELVSRRSGQGIERRSRRAGR